MKRKKYFSLENVCQYLVHLADTIYRNNVVSSDVETKKQGKYKIIKLFFGAQASDYAVSCKWPQCEENSLKENRLMRVKSLLFVLIPFSMYKFYTYSKLVKL